MRNKKLSDKQKLRDLSTTQAALQQMLTGLIQSRNTRDKNQPLAIKKMAIGIYINNYFKCKWLKCSNQKTQTG